MIYIMRHAQSEANAQNLIVSDPEIGAKSYGLTDFGRKQAHDAARRWDAAVDRIISSPFLRALETARIVQQVCGGKLEISENLRERFFGEFDMTDTDDYHKVWEYDRDRMHKKHGVESVEEVARRMMEVLKSCRGDVLLVSHGDPLQILQAELEGVLHTDIPKIQNAEIRPLRTLS